MKFILTPTSWILADLDPVEWNFLERLSETASGRPFPEDCQRRLLPDPIDVPAGERQSHEAFLQDWDEYVRPDLAAAFTEARNQVSHDLALAAGGGEGNDDEAEATGVPSQVVIDRRSADAWYSTLNQARLLMNEAHDLAEAIERFRPRGRGAARPDIGRMMLLAQYEFYTALQSILIETMMRERDDAGEGPAE